MKILFKPWMLLMLLACQSIKTPYETKTAEEAGYTYQYVVGDPMSTRIYTLDNGLKVFLSDYEKAPRAHVYIPVKAGGKNDPSDNTGLAHYLEHMMFKGTDKFGSLDYEEEKVMLDSIERMFNYYANLTDTIARKEYYKKIDAYSNEAAKFAIPNEYDKMISTLGGKGLNAYTTEDRTVYTIDIPSNELPRFLAIEGVRFRKIVNRLFHTELETVYEEKNRSLDNDYWKVFEAMSKNSFKQHPYGTQTVIGTIDHLKNPSITEIKKYFQSYYRPNNVAICISGDIDYTKTIKLIDQNFGDWQPNENLPNWVKVEEEPISQPIVEEVYGPDAEFVFLGYRLGGTGSADYLKAQMVDYILNNSEAGLIDLNLKQKQEVLDAGSFLNDMNDYSIHMVYGNAKQNQSLEEVKDLLLKQIDILKKGDFEDWLLDAVVTDFKKSSMYELESNRSRANNMVMAFTNGIEWSDYIQKIDKMAKITKEDIVAFANEKYNDNYVAIYKRTGEDLTNQKVEKPQITKVPLNREDMSGFHKEIVKMPVEKLKPVFLDYKEDINRLPLNNIEVITKINDENELFDLTYLIDFGKNADPKLAIAVEYLEFLGTDKFTAEEFKKELYKIGCSFSVNTATERTYVTLSGLNENMEKATNLFESLLANPQPDQEALDKMVGRIFKSRSDAKKSKQQILWSGLFNYGKYGKMNPFNDVLSNISLSNLEAENLVSIIKSITGFPHKILYYGPRPVGEIKTFLTDYHNVPDNFSAIPPLKVYEEVDVDKPLVYWTDYDMVQTEIVFLSKSEKYSPGNTPSISIFNEYFGGGMNSIVFQEIREAQGLAYSVFSSYAQPSKKDRSNYLYAYVGTQSDKQSEAMGAIIDLLNNMPKSETAFEISKQAILNKIESGRITGSDVIWDYIAAEDRGIDYDIRKEIYSNVKEMSFEDLESFHEKFVKDKKYITVIVGSRDKIDFEALQAYGEITELSLDELFGYEDAPSINPM